MLAYGITADAYNPVTTWRPSDLGAALYAWWDAADPATITADATGAVSQWNDKSGNLRHGTSSGAAMPVTGKRKLNGINVLDFDSTVNAKMLTVGATTLPQPFTLVTFARQNRYDTRNRYIINGPGLNLVSVSYGYSVFAGLGLSPGVAGDQANGDTVVAIVNGTNSMIRLNQKHTAQGDAGAAGWAGQTWNIGRNTNTTAWHGQIGELLIVNRALTEIELASAEAYLRDKWLRPTQVFDPLSIPWVSAFWASDPKLVPPADGAVMPSWANAVAGKQAVSSGVGVQPTYRAFYANLNTKPAVEFALGQYLTNQYNAGPVDGAQPNHFVMVAWLDPAGTAYSKPWTGGGANNWNYIQLHPDGTAQMSARTSSGSIQAIPGGSRPGVPYIVSALFNSSSSTYRINGTDYPVAVDIHPHGGMRISDAAGGYLGAIAFLGVSDTPLTGQQIANLENWAAKFYGVPLAPVPPQIPGLFAWWDAADATTITDAGGGKVSQWNDKSTNGRNLTQATDTDRPITGVRTLNGLNVLEFDPVAVNRPIWMQTANFVEGSFQQPMTMLFACQPDATGNHQLCYNGGGAGPGLRSYTAWQMHAGISLVGGSATLHSPHVVTAEYNLTTSRLRDNGVTVATGDVGAGAMPSFLLSRNNTPNSWYGQIGEVVVYNRVLSDAELDRIESYLKAKWGIA